MPKRLSRATTGPAKPDTIARHDGSYILTGGLGGIGLAMARWLVESGAGRVILDGRSTPIPRRRKRCWLNFEQRAEIVVVLGDIAAPGVAERLVSAAEDTGLALRGLMHSAVVLDDQIVAGLSSESLERVSGAESRWCAATARRHGRPRARLVGRLLRRRRHCWTPDRVPTPAASAWLDGHRRLATGVGLPATTINWGRSFNGIDHVGPLLDVRAGPDFTGRRHRGAGGHPGQPPH